MDTDKGCRFFPFAFEFSEQSDVRCAADMTFSIDELLICTERFKLKLLYERRNHDLKIGLYYDGHMYHDDDIRRLGQQFQTILTSAIDTPESFIQHLNILSESERQQLLYDFNHTTTDYRQDVYIHTLIEEHGQHQPNKIAVIGETQQLTYGELNSRANQLASHLHKRGVGPDTLVGIYMDRVPDVVVAILGILKAGGAYVPLDPSYPKDRLAFMLKDAEVPLLLSQQRFAAELPEHHGQVIYVDTDWPIIAQQSDKNGPNRVSPTHLAYVIYTSGSTGKPKGVMVTHANLRHYVQALPEALGIGGDDRYLHTASIAFSSSVRQFMAPLSQGATLVLATPKQRAEPLELWHVIKQHGVTVIDLVPSHWRSGTEALARLDPQARTVLLDNKLRLILSASEALTADVPRTWSRDFNHAASLVNMYGQTETTGIVSIYPIASAHHGGRRVVPIGRPIPNLQLYVLDAYLHPVPIGFPGELYIGGKGVARGYLNRPELTRERFLPNPFNGGADGVLYRAGDRVRYRPDGVIEFMGRSDHQVKIRGFRIELEEIRVVLGQHPAVRESVVIAKDSPSGEKRLLAYVVPTPGQSPTPGALRDYLGEKLPDYMLPAAFICLDAMPLTPNGKLDRLSLPDPEQVRMQAPRPIIAARDALEEQLTHMWTSVLGCAPIGIHDDFFELGGHSLNAVQLFAHIKQVTGKNPPLATLVEAPTIAQLAARLRREDGVAPWSSLVALRAEGARPPFFCIHPGGDNILYYRDLAHHLGADQPVYGLQARGLDGKSILQTRMEDMAAHYIEDIRMIQPQGPYFLGGYCFGGIAAFEMARQLRAQGQRVGLLAIFHTVAPGFQEFSPDAFSLRYLLRRAGQRLDLEFKNLQLLAFQDKLRYVQDKATRFAGRNRRRIRHGLDALHERLQDLTPSTLRRVQAANHQAFVTYTPEPYDGNITLFRASHLPAGANDAPYLGWDRLTPAGVEVHEIPGYVNAIMTGPQAYLLARRLHTCLDAAQNAL